MIFFRVQGFSLKKEIQIAPKGEFNKKTVSVQLKNVK